MKPFIDLWDSLRCKAHRRETIHYRISGHLTMHCVLCEPPHVKYPDQVPNRRGR